MVLLVICMARPTPSRRSDSLCVPEQRMWGLAIELTGMNSESMTKYNELVFVCELARN